MSFSRLVTVLLASRLRSLGRFLAAHGFVLFILGPMIIGSGLWIAEGYLDMLRDPLTGLLVSDAVGVVGLTITLLVSALTLPACQREIFPIRSADSYLDALPIPESVRFHVAWASCWTRQLPITAILLVFLAVLGGEDVTPRDLAGWATRLLLALIPLTLIGMAALQLRVRFAAPNFRLLAGLAAVLTAVLLMTPADRLLILLPWSASAAQMQIALGQALAVSVPFDNGALGPPQAMMPITTALLYGLALGFFWCYRRRDLERARVLAWPAPRSGRALRIKRPPEFKPSRSKTSQSMWVQVRRDLVLIVRRFSPVVYLVTALTLVILAGAFLILPDLGFDARWTLRAVVFASVGAALSQVSLVPLLLKHQLPRFWMEKSSGVDPEEVWGAKLWLARILAVPAVMVSGGLLWTLPQASTDPAMTGLAFIQLLAAAWVVSSTVGYTAFEIAAQPVLGLIFSSLVGMALGGLFVFKVSAWWLWAPFYLILASKLAERASRRIRFTEVES